MNLRLKVKNREKPCRMEVGGPVWEKAGESVFETEVWQVEKVKLFFAVRCWRATKVAGGALQSAE